MSNSFVIFAPYLAEAVSVRALYRVSPLGIYEFIASAIFLNHTGHTRNEARLGRLIHQGNTQELGRFGKVTMVGVVRRFILLKCILQSFYACWNFIDRFQWLSSSV